MGVCIICMWFVSFFGFQVPDLRSYLVVLHDRMVIMELSKKKFLKEIKTLAEFIYDIMKTVILEFDVEI